MIREAGFIGSSGLVLSGESARELTDGVKYIKKIYKNNQGYDVLVYVLTIAPGSLARAAVWAAPQGQIKTVPVQVKELETTGRRVLAAANADFFRFFSDKTLTTYGAQIVDGRVIVEPNDSMEKYCNNWFGMTYDGKYVISNAAGYYSAYKGKLTCAVGGGYRLVQNGVVKIKKSSQGTDTTDSDITATDMIKDSHLGPRTWVGISQDNGLAILCADGRSKASAGVSYSDQVQLILNLDMNITEVLNFDGGGSTAMVVEKEKGVHEVVNLPCSDPMRPVADIIAVVL